MFDLTRGLLIRSVFLSSSDLRRLVKSRWTRYIFSYFLLWKEQVLAGAPYYTLGTMLYGSSDMPHTLLTIATYLLLTVFTTLISHFPILGAKNTFELGKHNPIEQNKCHHRLATPVAQYSSSTDIPRKPRSMPRNVAPRYARMPPAQPMQRRDRLVSESTKLYSLPQLMFFSSRRPGLSKENTLVRTKITNNPSLMSQRGLRKTE